MNIIKETKLLDLHSSSSYKPHSSNPITNITNLVSKAIDCSSLDLIIKKHNLPCNLQPQKIYGQPKIHKKDIPH